jgi:hypothetical protein
VAARAVKDGKKRWEEDLGRGVSDTYEKFQEASEVKILFKKFRTTCYHISTIS